VERIDDNYHGGKTPHLHDMEPLKNASGLAEFQLMKTFPPLEHWMQINTSSFKQEQPDLGRPVDEFSRTAMDCHLRKIVQVGMNFRFSCTCWSKIDVN
jgi:hypothetical protein